MDPAFITMGPALPRRAFLHLGLGLALTRLPPAHALKPGKPSKERLLRNAREEKSEEELEEERARVAEERRQRLERQRELQAEADRRRTAGTAAEEGVEIESNLRGQYYYPTARKRYLPRVKVAYDTLPKAEAAVGAGEWGVVGTFAARELADAVGPMRLYTSSLAGGGLSINARFIEKMNAETLVYETCLKTLVKAVKTRDSRAALRDLQAMKNAITNYRQYGRLEAPDFGIGEIPTGARVGSGFGNNNSALYGRNRGVLDGGSGWEP